MPLMNPVLQASHLPQVYPFQGNNVFPQVVPYQQRVAVDPMSELPVAAVVDASDLQVPNFADDEQMYHYCVTRLQRALNECQGTTEVSGWPFECVGGWIGLERREVKFQRSERRDWLPGGVGCGTSDAPSLIFLIFVFPAPALERDAEEVEHLLGDVEE